MSRLAIVTVLYRSADMLAKTLPTWEASARGLDVDFVFVDNSPGDGASDIVTQCVASEAYQYFPDRSNPGFAAGANRGVAAARAPHVLLLNPDVWLAEDSLNRILDAIARRPEDPIAVGLTMHGEDFAGIDLNLLSLFIDRSVAAARPPLGPSGGAAVFPRSLLLGLGGFDEALFAWGEDADLAMRMYSAGIRTAALDVFLPHAWGHSVEGDAGLSAFRAYLLARNRLLVAWRNFTWPLALLALPVLIVAHGGLAVRRLRQGVLGSFLKGISHGITRGPAARRRRTGPRFGVRTLLNYVRDRRGV